MLELQPGSVEDSLLDREQGGGEGWREGEKGGSRKAVGREGRVPSIPAQWLSCRMLELQPVCVEGSRRDREQGGREEWRGPRGWEGREGERGKSPINYLYSS